MSIQNAFQLFIGGRFASKHLIPLEIKVFFIKKLKSWHDILFFD